jgi:hypothetical protein
MERIALDRGRPLAPVVVGGVLTFEQPAGVDGEGADEVVGVIVQARHLGIEQRLGEVDVVLQYLEQGGEVEGMFGHGALSWVRLSGLTLDVAADVR